MKKNDQNESQSMQIVSYAESQDPDTVIQEQPESIGMPVPVGGMPGGGAMPGGAMPGGAMPGGGGMPAPGGAMPGGVVPDIPKPGGTTDHSYQAPKNIQSSTITEFSTHFFVYDTEDDSLSGNYYFILKSNNGKLTLKEDSKYGIEEEITPDVFDKIQRIIERNNLVKLNGTDKITHGLPVEYQPCYLNAVYDSGEKLYFSMNNDPLAPWARELEFTLREELAKRGHKECLAPPSAFQIDNFNIEFLEGELVYMYDMINSKKYIMRSVYNKAKDDMDSEKIIEVPEGFYADLHNYIKSHDFKRFHTGQVSFDSNWKQGKTRYFSFYFSYENKKRVSTYSADTDKCNDFYREIPGLKAFFDKYIDDPNAVDASNSLESP